ncbi:hypothetical protein AVEN_247655-1 [Araneus ventricosus]|uniref:Tc1-like transposase DDE domain-containing protein n=1 Tax=Araneus ventricosus TaxID=182803 RepID=A0A4Y2RTM6_ARAVE|nr:hypothetical protein AVEN_247655-1 [Araneus ventricosus]
MAGLQRHCRRWRQCRRRVFVWSNMRSVLRLRAFSVHSYANTEKLHLVICSTYQKFGTIYFHENRFVELSSTSTTETLEQPPYSPDLTPSDFHILGPLENRLVGHHFGTDTEVQEAVAKCLRDLDSGFFYAGFNILV